MLLLLPRSPSFPSGHSGALVPHTPFTLLPHLAARRASCITVVSSPSLLSPHHSLARAIQRTQSTRRPYQCLSWADQTSTHNLIYLPTPQLVAKAAAVVTVVSRFETCPLSVAYSASQRSPSTLVNPPLPATYPRPNLQTVPHNGRLLLLSGIQAQVTNVLVVPRYRQAAARGGPRRGASLTRQEEKRMSREVKLLLLGAGASGKSTVLKQMRYLHRKPFSPGEVEDYRWVGRRRGQGTVLKVVQQNRLLQHCRRDARCHRHDGRAGHGSGT